MQKPPQNAHVQQPHHLRRNHPLQRPNHPRSQGHSVRVLRCLLPRLPGPLCQNIFLHHHHRRIWPTSSRSPTQTHLLSALRRFLRRRSRSELVPPTLSHRSRVPRRQLRVRSRGPHPRRNLPKQNRLLQRRTLQSPLPTNRSLVHHQRPPHVVVQHDGTPNQRSRQIQRYQRRNN